MRSPTTLFLLLSLLAGGCEAEQIDWSKPVKLQTTGFEQFHIVKDRIRIGTPEKDIVAMFGPPTVADTTADGEKSLSWDGAETDPGYGAPILFITFDENDRVKDVGLPPKMVDMD